MQPDTLVLFPKDIRRHEVPGCKLVWPYENSEAQRWWFYGRWAGNSLSWKLPRKCWLDTGGHFWAILPSVKVWILLVWACSVAWYSMPKNLRRRKTPTTMFLSSVNHQTLGQLKFTYFGRQAHGIYIRWWTNLNCCLDFLKANHIFRTQTRLCQTVPGRKGRCVFSNVWQTRRKRCAVDTGITLYMEE